MFFNPVVSNKKRIVIQDPFKKLVDIIYMVVMLILSFLYFFFKPLCYITVHTQPSKSFTHELYIYIYCSKRNRCVFNLHSFNARLAIDFIKCQDLHTNPRLTKVNIIHAMFLLPIGMFQQGLSRKYMYVV